MGGEAAEPYEMAPMNASDVAEVLAIERASFAVPWSAQSFLSELALPYSVYRVARLRGGVESAVQAPGEGSPLAHAFGWRVQASRQPVVGYAGLQVILDEGHITTIAVHSDCRRQGIGELLLLDLFEQACPRGVLRLTLEVRVSNAPALALYEKYGFAVAGRRLRYYANGEDALIMWTERQDTPAAQARLGELSRLLRDRLRTGDRGAPRA